MTQNPMFCLQIKIRDVGYDSDFAEKFCWFDGANEEYIFDDDEGFKGAPDGDEWDVYGYVDRWETVMVALTEEGLHEYMRLDGHNVTQRAFRGEIRIYVESFNHCQEMVAVREYLLTLAAPKV